MGDAAEIFSFVMSVFNFLILAFVFNKVAILPMVEAVRLRAEGVNDQLHECDNIMAEARKTEATYQEQFSRLEADKEELRATNQRELERVTLRVRSQAESDAEHTITRAKLEVEKSRAEALAQLQHEVVVQALSQVEGLLKQNLDSDAHLDLNRQFLGKVGSLRA